MLASQIFLSTIILFILVKTIVNLRREKLIDKTFYWLWIGFWLLVLFLIHFTGILSSLAHLLGIGRGVDLAVYTSIILIFYLLFVFFNRIKKLEKQLTEITRNLALKNWEKDYEKKSKMTKD
jgi:hypothetical protein